ncbi:three-Cys-motif partner protein TcmP [Sporomusa sp. KB1]|jgi:three-Cys-motif partner protein|uniref:three-Cys-motif partner protein TcmP n=1 Tax=Sporomusa sp. KB1 TaxID=943346 RepID=UPI0011A0F87A|nr:three-Cys-motif partner protein TcmP [Sporomusa sp. KB1]TWH48490.1 three-Cys-motif partner protein [Sporomusa sp. KB1]
MSGRQRFLSATPDMRIYQLLLKAGGTDDTVDLTAINLAAKVRSRWVWVPVRLMQSMGRIRSVSGKSNTLKERLYIMEFFDQQREASAVKTEIVRKYFSAWSRIVSATHDNIGYVDLFSGPGCYDDGTESTPMELLRAALRKPEIARKLHVYFNDIDSGNISRLQECINRIPHIELILPRIEFSNSPVGNAVAQQFNSINLIPVFSFIDPFGYVGITKELITSLTKDKGCDCIFFLNYSRINAGINNPLVVHHMEALFGQNIETLRSSIQNLRPADREVTILDLLSKSFERINNQRAYVLPFRFLRPKGSRGSRTSHYLIFLSKHPLGYKIMKEIMHSTGGSDDEGIGTFEFVPVQNPQLTLLFRYGLTLEQLKTDLCTRYRGRTITVKNIFDEHNYGTPFIISNYKEALRQLESEGRIRCNPAVRQIRNGVKTMADKTLVIF